MAEVLAEYPEPVVADDGTAYRAQACGSPNADGLWEGWIEFVAIGDGTAIRSPRETTQPNRVDTVYWASGLTPIYLEGALSRALNPLVRRAPSRPEARFDGPAAGEVTLSAPRSTAPSRAVLDPFSVYEKSENLLRQELGAFSPWHLVNIVVAYDLSDQPEDVLNRLPAASLVEIIVSGVRMKTATR